MASGTINKPQIFKTQLAGGASATYTIQNNMAIIISGRNTANNVGIFEVDYWNSTSLLLAGNAGYITITKSASSASITITNSGGITVPITII